MKNESILIERLLESHCDDYEGGGKFHLLSGKLIIYKFL